MLVDNFIKVSDQAEQEERARRIREAKSGRVVKCATRARMFCIRNIIACITYYT